AGAQLQRHRAHLAQVGGDALAGGAVAAGGALDEHAVLVAQADGQAVELGLDREHRVVDAEALLDAADEIGDLRMADAVVGVVGPARPWRRFAVTLWPVAPSPRVAPWTNTPSS